MIKNFPSKLHNLSVLFGIFIFSSAHAFAHKVEVYYRSETSPLKDFDLSNLGPIKTQESTERDPSTGNKSRFSGPKLHDLIEKSMEGLSAEKKANIDLVILKTQNGGSAYFNRAFLVKYPVLLALKKDRSELGAPLSVVPWDSKPKVKSEKIPLEPLFLSGVTRIELANAQERFKSFYLKKRTDPAAVRGERFFMQACVSCHNGNGLKIETISQEARSKRLSESGHPSIGSSRAFKLEDSDRRYLVSYLNAYRGEH